MTAPLFALLAALPPAADPPPARGPVAGILPIAAPAPAVPAQPPPAGPAADPARGPVWSVPPAELVPRAVARAAAAAQAPPWWVERTGVTALHARGLSGKGVRVGVIDTGCDDRHPWLKGKVIKILNFSDSRTAVDVQGHGTHVCGIVSQMAPAAEIVSLKALGDEGAGYDDDIARAIDAGVKEGCGVLNLSLGSSARGPFSGPAIARALAAGVVVVAAAGNTGPGGGVGYPGAEPGVLCVAAVDRDDRPAPFSSRGPRVDVATYGVGIRSAYPGGREAEMSGTSMAAPNVAGGVAAAVTGRPGAGAGLAAAARAAAADLPPPGRDDATGWGLFRPVGLAAADPPPRPMPGFVLTEADFPPAVRERWEKLYPGGKLRLELPSPRSP